MSYKEERFNFPEAKTNYSYDALLFFVTNSPLDIFKRTHRFFYAATYGTLAHLCTKIMAESTYAFNFHGPDYLKGVYFEY